LKQLRRPEELAALRDRPAEEIVLRATLRAYRDGQRDGDLFKVTES